MNKVFRVLLQALKSICISIKFVLLGFHFRISNNDCDEDCKSNEQSLDECQSLENVDHQSKDQERKETK